MRDKNKNQKKGVEGKDAARAEKKISGSGGGGGDGTRTR